MSNLMPANDWAVIQIKRFNNAANGKECIDWKNALSIPYTKYNIKETDMRIKTATFSSPQYLDLTTGLFTIRIVSKYHENFAGVVLDCEYDEKTGIYNYQCQDFSRMYMQNVEFVVKNQNVFKELIRLITHGKSTSRKGFEKQLSGLRALNLYDQSLYAGNMYKGNPFNQNISYIARDKPIIEVIRSIVFSRLGYFDVYFNDRGVLQIEPLSKNDWENTGLHLSDNEYSERKFKFSTTNTITGVNVNGTDAKKGVSFNSTQLTGLNLTTFFGNITTSISDPVQQTTAKNTTNAVKTNNDTTNINKNNPYGTKTKTVYLNIDLIDGHSSDQGKMNTMVKILQKNGWKCKTCGVGSESHYEQRGNVKNGIWFTLYGGACAGTLKETATNDWFRRPLVNHGSRTVVGFFPPAADIRKGGSAYKWLPRAHDDGFSGNFSGLSYPSKLLTNCAIPFMYAKTPAEMVAKFLKGGDNPEACNKNWKFYSK